MPVGTKEWVIYSPTNPKNTEILVEYDDTFIACSPSCRDDELTRLLKDLKLSWSSLKKRWQREINEFNGTLDDRLIELIALLLANGYPVEVYDASLIDRAINEDYEVEQERWITARAIEVTEGEPAEIFLLISFPYNPNFTHNVSRLPQCRWVKPYWRVPIRYHEIVKAFAEDYCFQFSKKAVEMMDNYTEEIYKVEKQRVTVLVDKMRKHRRQQPTKRQKKSIEEILDALKDE